MLHKTRAIVLHSLKYGDTSLIVHAFTEEWGRKAFLLKGVRKSKKNNRSNMYQALFFLDLEIYYRDNRDLQWIKEASFPGMVPSLSSDLVKSTQAIFLSELLMMTIWEEEKNKELFDFLMHTLDYFNRPGRSSSSFHILFLFQLCRHLGFYPNNNFSEKNKYFNLHAGSFSSSPDSANIEEESLLATYWSAAFNLDYSTVDQVFDRQDFRNIFLDSLLQFYRLHQHSMREIKSLEILRTVFG